MDIAITSIILLLIAINPATSRNSVCEYDEMMYEVIDIIYFCEVKNALNIKSRDKAFVDSETGAHMDGKSNEHVLGWWANNKKVEFFPQGLEKVFENLKAISVWNGRIKEISQADLKPYTNLEFLELYDNNIEYLEDELFKFNPKLKVITFSRNNLFHIYENVFTNLENLRLLYLKNCKCVNVRVDSDEMFSNDIIRLSVAKCDNAEYAEAIENFEALNAEVSGLTYENLQPFKEKLAILEKEISSPTLSSSSTLKAKYRSIKIKLWSIKKPRTLVKTQKNQTISNIDEFFGTLKQTYDDFGKNMLDELEGTGNKLDYEQNEELDGLTGAMIDLKKNFNELTDNTAKENSRLRGCIV